MDYSISSHDCEVAPTRVITAADYARLNREAEERSRPFREAAKVYACRGWRIFQVRSLDFKTITNAVTGTTRIVSCSCGNTCGSPGKHPQYRGWQERASSDLELASRWSSTRNIGIRTGEVSGIFVVDLDGRGGIDDLEVLKTELNFEIPPTPIARSGSGTGMHLFFKWPVEGEVCGWAKIKGTKIDTRGTGGFVVAAPSIHKSGNRYEWLSGFDLEVAECPPPLLAWILEEGPKGKASKVVPFELPSEIAGDYEPLTEQLERRLVAYLGTMPESVESDNGSARLMAAARVVVWGFNLGPLVGFEMLKKHFNPRCQPEWSDREILHKAEDANGVSEKYPHARGHLLGDEVKGSDDKTTLDAPNRPKDEPNNPPVEKPNFLTNFTTQGEGKAVSVEGFAAPLIHENLLRQTTRWPMRVGGALFAATRDDANQTWKPLWLTKPVNLFSWLQSQYPTNRRNAVTWSEGTGCLTKGEFHAYLQQNAAECQEVEAFPHYPPIPGHLYLCNPVQPGDGSYLERLLDFFCPLAPHDRELIRAWFLTLFWGGECGSRPMFLFTGDDAELEAGRGIGKSQLAYLAGELCGGTTTVGDKSDWADIVKRIPTPTDYISPRILLLDNLKTLRFSWADLEGQVTSPFFNGHRMYVGDARKANTLTVAITLNGVALSKDLAQRSVIVKLARPTYSGTWEAEVTGFIRSNRWQIISDIIAALMAPPRAPISNPSRWGAWCDGVLSRCHDGNAVLETLRYRSDEADDDRGTAGHIREALEAAIRGQTPTIDPATAKVWISSNDLLDILRPVIDVNNTTRMAKELVQVSSRDLPELKKADALHGRERKAGYFWTGQDCEKGAIPITLRRRESRF